MTDMQTVILTVAGLILVAMNTLAFTQMGQDKAYAHAGKHRIPEKTLFLSAWLFGALGGTAGMYFFHHKTRHRRFRYGFPAILLLQVLVLAAGGWYLFR